MNLSTKFLVIAIGLAIALISGTTWGLAQSPPDNPGPPEDPGPPGNTLASLNCSAGQIAKFDGNAWVCMEDLAPSPGTVMFFDLASCPAGWSAPAETKGRVLVGLPPGGAAKGILGEALTDLEDRFHNHAFNPAGVETGRSGVHRHQGSTDGAGLHRHTGETDSAGSHGHTGRVDFAGGHGHQGDTNLAGSHSHQGITNLVGAHSHGGETILGDSHPHSISIGPASSDVIEVERFLLTTIAASEPDHTHRIELSGGGHTHLIETSSSEAHEHAVNTSSVDGHAHPTISTNSNEGHAHSVSIVTNENHGHAVDLADSETHSHAVGTDDSSDHNHTVDIPDTVSTNAATSNVMPYIQLLLCRKD